MLRRKAAFFPPSFSTSSLASFCWWLWFLVSIVGCFFPTQTHCRSNAAAAEESEAMAGHEQLIKQLDLGVQEGLAAVGPMAAQNSAQKAQLELFDQLMGLPDSEHRYRAVLGYCNNTERLLEGPVLEDTQFGTISYELHYNADRLTVSKLRVAGLPAMDLVNGKADPYVEVYLFPGNEVPNKTEWLDAKLEGEFTKELEFNLVRHHQISSKKYLVFVVMDRDTGSFDEQIGQLTIPLENNIDALLKQTHRGGWNSGEPRHLQAPFGKKKTPFAWEQVQHEASARESDKIFRKIPEDARITGEARISMLFAYDQEKGLLSISGIHADKLPGKDGHELLGEKTSDTYILFYLSPGFDAQRTETIEKQSVLHKPIPEEELSSKLLLLVVMDEDVASNDDPIGQAIVSLNELLNYGTGRRRNSNWQRTEHFALEKLICEETRTFLQSKLPFTGEQLEHEVAKRSAIKDITVVDDEEENKQDGDAAAGGAGGAVPSSRRPIAAELRQHFLLYQDCVQKLLTKERAGGLNFQNHKLLGLLSRHLRSVFKRFFADFVLPRPVMLARRVLRMLDGGGGGLLDWQKNGEEEGNVRVLLEIASTEGRETMAQLRRYLEALSSAEEKQMLGNFHLANVVSSQAQSSIFTGMAGFLTDRFSARKTEGEKMDAAAEDSPNSHYLSNSIQTDVSTKKLGKLTYRLDYDENNEKLNLFLVKANGLKAMDSGNTSDPYINVQLWPHERNQQPPKQTIVQPKTLDPIYNQHFSFPLKQSEMSVKMLKFSVYDHDKGDDNLDDPMGQVLVLLGDWFEKRKKSFTGNNIESNNNNVNVKDLWKHYEVAFIQPKDAGSIKFRLSQTAAGGNGQFRLSELQGIDLAAKDWAGKTSNPYIRLALLPEGKVEKSKGTPGKPGTEKKINDLNPVFDKDEFLLEPGQGQQAANTAEVKLTVYHDQKWGKDPIIGVAYLSLVKPLMNNNNIDNNGRGWLQLEPVTFGRLNYRLGYEFGQQELIVDLLRAKNLPTMDTNGASDPYVVVTLLDPKENAEWKKMEQTSQVNEKTLDPVFKETLKFKIPFDHICDKDGTTGKHLVFNVWDKSTTTSSAAGLDSPIGQRAVSLCRVFTTPFWPEHAHTYGQWARGHAWNDALLSAEGKQVPIGWPHGLAQERQPGMSKETINLIKKLKKHLKARRDNLGHVEFKLEYRFHSYEQLVVGKLIFTLVNARSLPAMDSGFGKKSDPFVKIQLKNAKEAILQKFKSKVVMETLDPEFNQQFHMDLSIDELRSSSLTLFMFDYDKDKEELFGELQVDLGELAARVEHWRTQRMAKFAEFGLSPSSTTAIQSHQQSISNKWHPYADEGTWTDLEKPEQNLLDKIVKWVTEKTVMTMGKITGKYAPIELAEFKQYLDMALMKDEPETEALLKQKQQELLTLNNGNAAASTSSSSAGTMMEKLEAAKKRLDKRLDYFGKQIQRLLKKGRSQRYSDWLHQILLARHPIDLGHIVSRLEQSDRLRMLQRIDRLTGYGKFRNLLGFYDKLYAHALRKTLHMENASQLLFFDHFLAKYGNYVQHFMHSLDQYTYKFSVSYVEETLKMLGFIDVQNERLAITVQPPDVDEFDVSREQMLEEQSEKLLKQQVEKDDLEHEQDDDDDDDDEDMEEKTSVAAAADNNKKKKNQQQQQQQEDDDDEKKLPQDETQEEEALLAQPLSPSVFLSDLLYALNQKLIDRLNMLFLGNIREIEQKRRIGPYLFKPHKFRVHMDGGDKEEEQADDQALLNAIQWTEWKVQFERAHPDVQAKFLRVLKEDHMEVCQLLFRANYLSLAIALAWAPVRKRDADAEDAVLMSGEVSIAVDDDEHQQQQQKHGDEQKKGKAEEKEKAQIHHHHHQQQEEEASPQQAWLVVPDASLPEQQANEDGQLQERLWDQLEAIARTLLLRFNHRIPMPNKSSKGSGPHYYQIGLSMLDKLGYKMSENLAQQMVDEKVQMLQNLSNDLETHTEDHDEHFTLDQLHYSDQNIQLFSKAAEEHSDASEQKQSGVELLLQRLFSWLQRKVERQYNKAKGKRSRVGRFIFAKLHFFCSELAGAITGKTPKMRFFFRTFLPMGYYGYKLAAMLLKMGKAMVGNMWLMMKGKVREMHLKEQLYDFMKEFGKHFSWKKWQTVKQGAQKWGKSYDKEGRANEQEQQQLLENFDKEFAVDDEEDEVGNVGEEAKEEKRTLKEAMQNDQDLNSPRGLIGFCKRTVSSRPFYHQQQSEAADEKAEEEAKYECSSSASSSASFIDSAHSAHRTKRNIADDAEDNNNLFGTSNSTVRIKRGKKSKGASAASSGSKGKSSSSYTPSSKGKSTVASNPPSNTGGGGTGTGKSQAATGGTGTGGGTGGKSQVISGGDGNSSYKVEVVQQGGKSSGGGKSHGFGHGKGSGKSQMASGGHGHGKRGGATKWKKKLSESVGDHKRLFVYAWTFGNAIWALMITFPVSKGAWHINCHGKEKWYIQLLKLFRLKKLLRNNLFKFGKKLGKKMLKKILGKGKKNKKHKKKHRKGEEEGEEEEEDEEEESDDSSNSNSSSNGVDSDNSSGSYGGGDDYGGDYGDYKKRRRRRKRGERSELLKEGLKELGSALKDELTGPKCGHYIATFISLSHVFVFVLGVIVLASL